MLIDQLFKPWYEANPMYDVSYGGGMVALPWEVCDFDLNFGRLQKKDIELEDQVKLIELALSSGALQDPIEIRNLLEDAGLGLREEYGQAMEQQYNDYGAMPQEMYGSEFDPGMEQPIEQPMQESYNFANQKMGSPPMDNPIYDSMARDVREYLIPNEYDGQPSDPRLTFTQEGGPGSGRKKGGGAEHFDKTYGIGKYDKGPESPATKKALAKADDEYARLNRDKAHYSREDRKRKQSGAKYG
jgi:hypothetical protein